MYQRVHKGGRGARLLVLGDGPLEAVALEEAGSVFSLGPERQALAEAACQRLREQGQTVFANPIYRLTDTHVGATLTLGVERGDYGQVVGTKAHPEWGVKAWVLAVCCVLECPQGFVVERRSARVAAAPGLWHVVPSGSLQPPHGPLATLLAEAEEELGLQPSELCDLRCLGLLYGEDSGVYQLICAARTEVPFSTFSERERSGAWEQDGLVLAPIDPEQLPRWMAGSPLLTSAGRVALWAEGGRRWGPEWFERHSQEGE